MVVPSRGTRKDSKKRSKIRTSVRNRLLPEKRKATKNRRITSKKKTQKKVPFLKKKATRFTLKWGCVSMIWVFIVILAIVLYYAVTLPDISKLGVVEKKHNITIINETGDVLASYGDLYGEYIPYHDMPPKLIQAVLATEDRRFFDHFGVDPIGLMRAAYVNFHAERVVQGGSTITQQLAKIVFLTPERTLQRKVKEAILALWLEYTFSKEEILAIYLNRVYLGSGNYGVAAAARYYFGKDVRDVNYSEAAILAGLLKAPSRFSPANNPKKSKARARQVLLNMVDAGYLTLSQVLDEQEFYPAALEAGVKESLKQPYFADWVLEQLPDYIGNITSDITVVTTLDMKLQNLAEKTVKRYLDKNGESMDVEQGALVTLAPDGRILAMVGGKNYYQSQFNRVAKAQRQPGSAFKLFVYLAALEEGYRPGMYVQDSPVTVKKWTPKNYNGRYMGDVTLSQSLAKSINTVAVKLSEEVGREKVMHVAKRLGIQSHLAPIPSIALGASEVNLLELTRAYAHLASNGMAVFPYGIAEIRDANDIVLYKRRVIHPQRVLKKQVAADMNSMLVDVVQTGTARAANIGRPAGAKTGTSQNFRDAWIIGFTPDLITGVWVGNDDNRSMKGVTGGKLPAQIWRDYMKAAHANKAVRQIPLSPYRFDNRGRQHKSIWDSILKIFGD